MTIFCFCFLPHILRIEYNVAIFSSCLPLILKIEYVTIVSSCLPHILETEAILLLLSCVPHMLRLEYIYCDSIFCLPPPPSSHVCHGLIIAIIYCIVVRCLRVLCYRRRRCPGAIVKRFQPQQALEICIIVIITSSMYLRSTHAYLTVCMDYRLFNVRIIR